MAFDIDNWKAQIKRGYLELSILMIIKNKQQIYGFDLIEELKKFDLVIKEGTLYPLLNRLAADGVLSYKWDTENTSGHPRKFYACTQSGLMVLNSMQNEFNNLWQTYCNLAKKAM